MDSITHVVVGAVTGSALAGKKLGKKALLWGALANSIPDIDIVTHFWMNDPDAILAHRGFTHSILFAFLISTLLSWLFTRYNSNKEMTFNDWMKIFLSGTLFHILLDSMTTYGTGLFEPFSHVRISFNNIFVADPFFTIWFLVPFVALLIIKNKSRFRPFWARFGVIAGSVYLLYTVFNKYNADVAFKQFYTDHNISTQNYFSAPAPLNNWLWMGIAKDHDSIYACYHSVFDKKPIQYYHAAAINEFLLDPVKENREVQTVIRLSQGYYSVEKESDKLVFCDARFGLLNGWAPTNEPAKFVFRFDILHGKNDSIIVKQGQMPEINGDAFKMLIERIKGE